MEGFCANGASGVVNNFNGLPHEALSRAEAKMNKGQSLEPNWMAAADCYQEALQILVQVYGDLSPQSAFAYFKYGEALLLGDMETGEDDGDESDGEETLQLSWEVLECARVAYSKVPGPDSRRALSAVHLRLGDLGTEIKNYGQAIKDYTECLGHLQQCVAANDRHVAEVYHLMANTYIACSAYEEAEASCRTGYQLCVSRQSELVPFSPEYNDIEQLKALLAEKIEEIRQQPLAHRTIVDTWGSKSAQNSQMPPQVHAATNVSSMVKKGEIPAAPECDEGMDDDEMACEEEEEGESEDQEEEGEVEISLERPLRQTRVPLGSVNPNQAHSTVGSYFGHPSASQKRQQPPQCTTMPFAAPGVEGDMSDVFEAGKKMKMLSDTLDAMHF
eukprot:comp17431_c0_seq1/m.16834 comp17431_c0_seq1/g.16834  ORF comp17431_c0_seq1/g.16834 comp17431_c0_seq1/m.16834 type:complete len:388 (-) comp17431_c0_seq1:420-1583(-)